MSDKVLLLGSAERALRPTGRAIASKEKESTRAKHRSSHTPDGAGSSARPT